MPIRTSRGRSAVCPNSPVFTCISTGRARLCTSVRRKCSATGSDRYLGAHGISPRIDALLNEAQRLETIVTDSVVEALALENHLIKQRVPKYNILLRDDKNYPYLQLTTGEPFPRVLVARRVERDEHFYAGPVPAGVAGATDDVAVAQAVRHPLVQRGDHRRAGPSVPRIRHQTLRGAVRARDLRPPTNTVSRWSTRGCSWRGGTRSWSRR